MATKYLDNTGLAYFWGKIKSWVTSRGYITSSGSITGNAGTATKLATARSISAGNIEFQGSANFDGSGNIALNVTNHRSVVSVGNRNNYPFHRIAYISTLAGNYTDRGITFLVSKDYTGGGWGICRVIFRTNNATGGQVATCNVQWLVRSGEISADSIQVGFCNTANASYIDVFYKSGGTYHSAVCRVLAHSNGRNSVGRGFTVVSASTEASNTTATDPKTSVESYKTVADAGTALHSQAYTDIIAAVDVGVVGTAATASAVAWSGVTGKPSTFTPSSHNQASNTINAMTGYSKPSSTSAIATTDSLNTAIGKLEKETEYLGDEILLVDAEAANGVAIASANQLFINDLQEALDSMLKTKIYPVGSTYFSLTDSRNPATILGFGTWAKIEGRFLLGASSSYAANSTGGEATHTLTESEMPQHYHDSLRYKTPDAQKFGCNSGTLSDTSWTVAYASGKGRDYYVTGNTGGSQAHNNMPPYLAGYLWRRTA